MNEHLRERTRRLGQGFSSQTLSTGYPQHIHSSVSRIPKQYPRLAAQAASIAPSHARKIPLFERPLPHRPSIGGFRQDGRRLRAGVRAIDGSSAAFRWVAVWPVEPFPAAARLRCTGNFRAQSPGQRHAANILRRRGAAAISNIDTSCPVHGAAIGHRERPTIHRATSFAQCNASRGAQKQRPPF
jgi:hypothetical protein